jgi:hypothetical protein
MSVTFQNVERWKTFIIISTIYYQLETFVSFILTSKWFSMASESPGQFVKTQVAGGRHDGSHL